jgi:FkbM family methyltransferase
MEPTSPSRRLLWWLTRTKGPLQVAMLRFARAYIHAFHDYSYNCRLNGEQVLLDRLRSVGLQTIFDVGANVGDWSLYARHAFPAATVHAFELSEDTRAVLRTRLASHRITIVDAALGDTDGEVPFKDFGDCSGLNTLAISTTFHDWRSPALRLARVIRGDTYCREALVKRIDLLKIDVEGYEGTVLEGFGPMLNPSSVRCLQFEYGYGNGDMRWLMRDFVTFLADRGYVVGKLWHDGVAFTPFNYSWNDFESGPNYVAVGRDDLEVLRAVTQPHSPARFFIGRQSLSKRCGR